MTSFDSTKMALSSLLHDIETGTVQLPDFQRGWVWDDSHIRALLVSIARSFPIGSVMLLETGGSARFQIRPIEGIQLQCGAAVQLLILDGQQRLTSLTQVLKLTTAVKTKDNQKREAERYYYIDIEKALQGSNHIEDAVFGVDATKTLRKDFGRELVRDLSSEEKEYQAFCFPCNQILNSDRWEEGLMAYDQNLFPRYMQFRSAVLNRFREYQIPIITLKKEVSKEAVCLVFEKVNTGGVPLSVFELVTASYAADGFNLRDDWYGNPRQKTIGRIAKFFAAKPLLRDLEPTDFLQGISLLHTFSERRKDVHAGKSVKDTTAVSAKREQVLSLPLSAYEQWAGPFLDKAGQWQPQQPNQLTQGFLLADQFLRREGFYHPDYLPYRSQIVPLAAVMVHLKDRWLEPKIYDKLAKWFWCGVFGELYGGATETRIALDMQDLLAWIESPTAPEPATVIAAGFQASRLDTLRTRTSAAYRGLYVLLQREGARDLFWKARITELDQDDVNLEIHHIFPQKWCKDHEIPERVFNSIVNKTPISYKANKMIGGRAPSIYLEQLRTHPNVDITCEAQDAVLESHRIPPNTLRNDNFSEFYQQRRKMLLSIIEKAMGKLAMEIGTDEEIIDSESME